MVVALQFGASASAFAAFGRPSLASDDHAVHHRNLRILGIWEIGNRIIGKLRKIYAGLVRSNVIVLPQ